MKVYWERRWLLFSLCWILFAAAVGVKMWPPQFAPENVLLAVATSLGLAFAGIALASMLWDMAEGKKP